MMKLNIQLFASGTIAGTDTAKYCIMQVVWSATAGDSVSNKSSVTASVQVRKTNSAGSTGTFNGNVTINGTTISISKKFSPLGSSWKTVGSATIDVPHNSDGTKICNISAYLKQTGTTDMGGEYNANADVTLDTILRESTPTVSASSVEMGSSVTIYTNRKSSSFTHNIRYSFGSLSNQTSGLTYYNNVNTDTPFIPPISLAQQIPSATSGSATISCETFSGGTSIGIKTVGITLTVPSSVKPTISIGTPSEANATMISLNWGVFVQGKSQLSIPITASGSQGSWITGTTTTVNGSSYSGTSVITGTINASGSVGISSTTTDSRGRQTSTSSSATFVAYSNPTITTATASRCLSDGTDSDEGTYLKYSFAGSISPVSNHNGHLFKIGYRQKGIGSYTYTNVDTANYSINKSNIVLNLNLDTSKSYDIRFEANDTFTSTAIERVIDTGFDLMNFNASGKAMAIGKVSEASANEEKLEVGIPTQFLDRVDVDGYIQQWNANGRAGSGIIVRGNVQYPEASINYGNINGNQAYIVGWGTAGVDSFNIWSQETGRNVLEINKNGIIRALTPTASHLAQLNRRYMRARATRDQTPDGNTINVVFQNVDINMAPNDLELKTDGKITIISYDVHHIKVSCNLWVERGGSSYAWCHLWVGGTDICNYMIPKNNGGESWQSVVLTGIASVSYGTQITPSVYFNVADNANKIRGGTYSNCVAINVEVLD